jgi:hypothetical protein
LLIDVAARSQKREGRRGRGGTTSNKTTPGNKQQQIPKKQRQGIKNSAAFQK